MQPLVVTSGCVLLSLQENDQGCAIDVFGGDRVFPQIWDKAGIGLAVVHGDIPAENLQKRAGVGDRGKFNSIDR